MTRKVYDVAVKTGTYRDASGADKGRYQTVGAVMQGDDGRQFLLIERWFNPAGVEVQPGRTSIICSLFEPKPRDSQQSETGF